MDSHNGSTWHKLLVLFYHLFHHSSSDFTMSQQKLLVLLGVILDIVITNRGAWGKHLQYQHYIVIRQTEKGVRGFKKLYFLYTSLIWLESFIYAFSLFIVILTHEKALMQGLQYYIPSAI